MNIVMSIKKQNMKALNAVIKEIEEMRFQFATKKSYVTVRHHAKINILSAQLGKLIALCQNDKDILIIIEGLADGAGSTSDNHFLSELRANGVAEAIMFRTKLPHKMFQIDLFGENRINEVLDNSSDPSERLVRIRIKTVDDLPFLAYKNISNEIEIMRLNLEIAEAKYIYTLSRYR